MTGHSRTGFLKTPENPLGSPLAQRAIMASQRILLTGGAGFIGSYVADELLAHGYTVRILDSLIAQVHGPERRRPSYLSRHVELIEGDVRDPAAVARALRGVDAV